MLRDDQDETTVTPCKMRYLTFLLDQETCAIRMDNIKEVLMLENIAKVPRSPHYLCGVFNLRGTLIPLIDVRYLFDTNYVFKKEPKQPVIVFDVDTPTGPVVLGLLVNAIYEMIDVALDDIETNEHQGAAAPFISYIIAKNDRFILGLDMRLLLSTLDAELFFPE